jgi:peptide/nickel transport system permease protein
MLEVLNADYLRTARAKGVPEETVIRKHALGNAWIPIMTTIGTSLGFQLAGAIVVESVFTWPGVGRLAADAVMGRDVPLILGCVIMTSILYVLVQLIVDLLYAFVDPRIKSQYVAASKKKKHSSVAASKGDQAGTQKQKTVAAVIDQTSAVEKKDSAAEIARLESETVQVAAVDSLPSEDRSGKEVVAVKKETPDEMQKKIIERKTADIYERVSAKYRKRSQIGEIIHHISKNKGAMVGLIIFAVIFLTFIVSLFMSFGSVTAANVPARFTSPNLQFPFGTDNLGRNLLLRVVYGTRYSLAIGFGSVALATFIGVALGSVAGFYGRKVEDVIMRFSDILASMPGLLLGMVIVTVLGQSLTNLVIAVAVQSIPVFLRITRASILSVSGNEFVEAAKAIGLSNFRIIFTQVLPNGLAPIIVTVTASLGVTIIVAASLSFLGFGVPIPHPEWGMLISAGRAYSLSAPYIMTFPGAAIMITVLAFNLLGDGLRDALDPKLKKR